MNVYQTTLSKPDARGCYRREIGINERGKRQTFVLGTDRRLAELRKAKLERLWAWIVAKHKLLPIGPQAVWSPEWLPVGLAIAKGETSYLVPPTREPMEYPHRLAFLNEQLGDVITFKPSDVSSFKQGRAENVELIEVEKLSLQMAQKDLDQLANDVGVAAPNLAKGMGTFHEALSAYEAKFVRDSARTDSGALKASTRKRQTYVKAFKTTHADLPISSIDEDRMSELFAHWKNRPLTKSGKRCSKAWSKHTTMELWRFFTQFLDGDKQFHWTLPRNAHKINRRIEKLNSDKKVSAVVKEVYSPAELGKLNAHPTDWERLALYLGVNCGMGASELGHLTIDDFVLFKPHPFAAKLNISTTDRDCYWRGFRAKSFVFGEVILWPETVELVQWAIKRCQLIGSKHLFCYQNGNRFYNEDSSNPQSTFQRQWESQITATIKRLKLKDFPELPFGSLRDTLYDHLRMNHDAEIAGVLICHGSPFSGDSLADCYGNRPWSRLHKAVAEARQVFQPMFEKHQKPTPFRLGQRSKRATEENVC